MPRISIDITPAERQAIDRAVVAHEQPSAAAYVRECVPELLPAQRRGRPTKPKADQESTKPAED